MQFGDGFRSALLDGIGKGENAGGFARDGFGFEQTRSANEDMMILHAANHTAARDGFKEFGLCDGQVAFPGALHYGSRKRMFAALLKTGHDSKQFVFLKARGG